MGLLDLALGSYSPVACYMYPEPTVQQKQIDRETLFVFQYWPASLQVNYETIYAEHDIPGATHPLYQWVGGKGRTITFEAVFTSEIDTSAPLSLVPPDLLTLSGRYTVDVAAALARLQSYMMPTYGDSKSLNGTVEPPPRLILAFPGSGLAGSGSSRFGKRAAGPTSSATAQRSTFDAVTVLLFQAPYTIESWFPDGAPRVATVNFTFREVIQRTAGGNQTSITYVGAKPFADLGRNYKYDGRTGPIATAGGS